MKVFYFILYLEVKQLNHRELLNQYQITNAKTNFSFKNLKNSSLHREGQISKKIFYNDRATTAVFFIRIKLAITKLSITKTYRHGQAEVTSSSSPKTPKD
jgi:hypothetical protein